MLSLIPPTGLGSAVAAAGGAVTAAAAAAGMSTEETATGGGSSTSHVREQHVTGTKGGWEEQRHLLSGAEYGAMAAGGAESMTGIEGRTALAGGGVAVGAAGAMNEEFLRDYFTDVSI